MTKRHFIQGSFAATQIKPTRVNRENPSAGQDAPKAEGKRRGRPDIPQTGRKSWIKDRNDEIDPPQDDIPDCDYGNAQPWHRILT